MKNYKAYVSMNDRNEAYVQVRQESKGHELDGLLRIWRERMHILRKANATMADFLERSHGNLTQDMYDLPEGVTPYEFKEQLIARYQQQGWRIANAVYWDIYEGREGACSRNVRFAGAGRSITDERSADKVWRMILDRYDVQDLARKYGKESVLQARKLLTVNEFELRFGLAA